jgi:hypothetical protein
MTANAALDGGMKRVMSPDGEIMPPQVAKNRGKAVGLYRQGGGGEHQRIKQ